MASFIVKNILENYEKLAGFCFWTLSDIIEEYPLPLETFHGGVGLITMNGLKKPSYHAYRLLNLVGDDKIASGPGYFISKNSSDIQIILYNYCHYDSLYCSMDHSAISPTKRYSIFKDAFYKTFQFSLSGFTESEYEIKDTAITQSQGSSFDTWVELGAPDQMDAEEIQYISQKAVPIKQKTHEIINNIYTLTRTLAPHEVRLIRILLIQNTNF
jgi:xylan 1,4-beta-xylosidase